MVSVGLIFGGRSVEHKVSVASARTIARGLCDAHYHVRPLGIGPDGGWVEPDVAQSALDGHIDQLPPGGRPVVASLRYLLETDVDVLFPIVHGTWGEDGTLQGLCEMLDLPYVGAGVTASAIAMDKASCKRLLAAEGLPVVDWEIVTRHDFERSKGDTLSRLRRFAPPLFVKPSSGGSSVGVSKVAHLDGLEEAIAEALLFDDRLVVERGINGRELECAVLGYQLLEASTVGEIIPNKEFYDYVDKYIEDGAQLIAPATLPPEIAAKVRRLATDAFEAIGGWGLARVDFFLEGREGHEKLFINEINTLPGFTDISMYPRLWGLSGVPLPSLVDRLVKIGLERHADRSELDQGIKDWIASISS